MMMQERKINIMGISEARRETPGHDNYICMASGDPTGKYGVALIVTPEVANRIEDFKLRDRSQLSTFMYSYRAYRGGRGHDASVFFLNVYIL